MGYCVKRLDLFLLGLKEFDVELDGGNYLIIHDLGIDIIHSISLDRKMHSFDSTSCTWDFLIFSSVIIIWIYDTAKVNYGVTVYHQ